MPTPHLQPNNHHDLTDVGLTTHSRDSELTNIQFGSGLGFIDTWHNPSQRIPPMGAHWSQVNKNQPNRYHS